MNGIEFAQIIGPFLLCIMMLGMGMGMGREDILRIVREPKAVTLGTVNQMLVLPLVGLLVATLFNVPGTIAAGIILLTLCPGGVGSNMISLLVRGDAALSVTLTFVSSCLIILTLPPLVTLTLDHFMGDVDTIEFPIFHAFLRVLFVTLLPIALGMLIRRQFPGFAAQVQRYLKAFGFVLMGLMISGIVIKEWQLFVEYSDKAGAITLTLCAATMALGFYSARFFQLNKAQSRSISIEVGMQNSSLAIVIAGLLGNAELAVPAIIYTIIVCLVSLWLIIWANWLDPALTDNTVLSLKSES